MLFQLREAFNCYKTIDKPQQFHRYVHKPLKVHEHRLDCKEADFDKRDVDPSDKEWRTLFSYHEIQKFFHDREESLKFSDQEIRDINKETQDAESFDDALQIVSGKLDDKFIYNGYFDYSGFNTLRQCPGGPSLGVAYEEEGETKYFNYYGNIAGGIKNMFATTLSLARIAPKIIAEKAKRSFSDMQSFINRVKGIAKKNIDILLGFSKLDISFLFKFFNILGENNHQEKEKNYNFYDFNEKYFTVDNAKNPSKILPYRALASDLIKSMRKDPSYMRNGSKVTVDLNNIHSYGCPAIFVRTKDGKQNMIQYATDVVQDLLNRTVFNNLDKWFSL